MKKATFLFGSLVALLIATSGWSDQKSAAQSMAMANASNPLILLPGMRSAPTSMPSGQIGAPMGSPSSSPAALPMPLVSDYTNYPNPFDSRKESTTIGYLLAADSKTTLTIYDLFGMKVLSWNFSAGQNGGKAGANTISWNGTNETGRKVSKGGYIAELVVESPQGTATAIRKIGVIH